MKEKTSQKESDTSLAKLSFEEALAELEQITHQLENSAISLEESIALYERGVKLRNICEQKLKEAEGRWMILKRTKEGQVVTEEIPAGKIPELNDFSESVF